MRCKACGGKGFNMPAEDIPISLEVRRIHCDNCNGSGLVQKRKKRKKRKK